MTKYFVQRCQSIYVYNLWPNRSSKFKVHVILGIHKENMLIKLRNNVNMMVLEVDEVEQEIIIITEQPDQL